MKLYFLLSKDELITLLHSSIVIVPLARYVNILDLEKEDSIKEIENRLMALSVNTSKDYVLTCFVTDNPLSSEGIKLSIFDLNKILTFDFKSKSFYKRVFGNLSNMFIEEDIDEKDIDIDIEKIIELSNQKRLKIILAEELGITFSQSLEDTINQMQSELIIEHLVNFKREAKIPQEKISFLNDLITIGAIAKDEEKGSEKNIKGKYKGGQNIAENPFNSLLASNPLIEEKSRVSNAEFIQYLMEIIKSKKGDNTDVITKLNSRLSTKITGEELIVKLIYLMLVDIFREAEEGREFEIICGLFNELSAVCMDEVSMAYVLYFKQINYSDIYQSYYHYRKINSKEQIEKFGTDKKALEEQNNKLLSVQKELESKNNELNTKQQELKAKNELLESNNNQLDTDKKDLEEQNSNLLSMQKELESKNNTLNTEQQELKTKNEDLITKYKALENNYNKLDADKKALEEQNSNLLSAQKELESKNNELNTKRQELKAKNELLESNNNQLDADKKDLEEQNSNLLSMQKELESKNNTLNTEQQELKTKNEDLITKDEVLDNQNQELILERTDIHIQWLLTSLFNKDNINQFSKDTASKLCKFLDIPVEENKVNNLRKGIARYQEKLQYPSLF